MRFHIDGQDNYVTVDNHPPTMTSAQWENGSSFEFAKGAVAWAPLGKACAGLVEQSDVTPGVSPMLR